MRIDKYIRPDARQRASKGEIVFNSLMPNRSYWGTWGWNNRLEQVQHLTNWIYVACDTICSLLGQHLPNMAYVDDTSGEHLSRGQRRKLYSTDHKGNYIYEFRQQLAQPRGNGGLVLSNGSDGWDGAALVSKQRHAVSQYPGYAAYKAISNAQPHEQLDPLSSTHPLRRLIVNPNKYDTSYDLEYELCLFLLLCGVSYLWAVPNGYGVPCELWVIPAHWVWPRGTGGQAVDPEYQHLVDYYEVRPFGAVGGGFGLVRIPADEVITFTMKSPLSKLDGWSKLTAASQWIDTSESMDRSAWAQMQNQGMPSMFIELGEAYKDADDNQTARIEAKFAQKLGGEYNTGRPFVGKPGMKMTPLNWSPESMMYPTMGDSYRDKVLSIFHLSKVAIGMMDNMTYGSILAALAHTWIHCLNPLTGMIGQKMSKDLAPRFASQEYRKWLKEGGVWLDSEGNPAGSLSYYPSGGDVLFRGGRGNFEGTYAKSGYVRDPSGKRRISTDREEEDGREIRMWWPDGSPPDPAQVNSDIQLDFQCILPGQELQGRVMGGSKARYSGEAVKIVTRSGAVLLVTPKHPIATPGRFVPAGSLKEGQNLLCYVGEVDSTTDNDGKDAPAKVEKVFDTLSSTFNHWGGEVAAAPVDFHGDAINFKGKVQIVGSYGKLGRSRHPVVTQEIENGKFVGFSLVQRALGGSGHLCSVPVGKSSAAHTSRHGGLVGVGEFAAGEGLGNVGVANFATTFPAQSRPPALPDSFGVFSFEGGGNAITHSWTGLNQSAGFRGGPDGDFEPDKFAVQPDVPYTKGNCNLFDGFPGSVAGGQGNHIGDGLAFEDYLSFGPAADFDVGLTEGCVEDGSGRSVFAGKLRDTFPGQVALDEIVEVSKFHYDGPVYDFESPLGFIVVNTLLVSNCAAITTNEIRAIRGRPPYGLGGDNPLVQGPGGLMPLPLNVEEDVEGLGELVGAFTAAASGGGEEGQEGTEGGDLAGMLGGGGGGDAAGPSGGAAPPEQEAPEELTLEEPEGMSPTVEEPNGKPQKGWVTKSAPPKSEFRRDLLFSVKREHGPDYTEAQLFTQFKLLADIVLGWEKPQDREAVKRQLKEYVADLFQQAKKRDAERKKPQKDLNGFHGKGLAAESGAGDRRLDPSFSPEHPEECCPHCGARLERGDDGDCNRCGEPWPLPPSGEKALRWRRQGAGSWVAEGSDGTKYECARLGREDLEDGSSSLWHLRVNGRPEDAGRTLREVQRYAENSEDEKARKVKAAKPKKPVSPEVLTGPVAAGLAVVADDTGRVLLLQRQLDEEDPNAGKWEFPGGRRDENEKPLEAAVREWCEEVGHYLPPGKLEGEWVSGNGKYAGFVYRVASEDVIDHSARRVDADPSSGGWAAVAWVSPEDMAHHNLRPALLGDLDEVLEEVQASV